MLYIKRCIGISNDQIKSISLIDSESIAIKVGKKEKFNEIIENIDYEDLGKRIRSNMSFQNSL